MALFGEKYGDVVRMVEVGDGSYSRELCGGTHVRSTAEIGVFQITDRGLERANVRRIEAVTGPEAVALLRRHDALLREAAAALRSRPSRSPSAVAACASGSRRRRSGAGPARRRVDVAALADARRASRRRARAGRGRRGAPTRRRCWTSPTA